MHFFFFNDTATTEIYTLSLHDALPIYLLIVDIMLPHKDGWELVAELRRDRVRTPILFLTARDSVRDRVKGLELRSEEHTSELQSQSNLVCRLLLEKKTN